MKVRDGIRVGLECMRMVMDKDKTMEQWCMEVYDRRLVGREVCMLLMNWIYVEGMIDCIYDRDDLGYMISLLGTKEYIAARNCSTFELLRDSVRSYPIEYGLCYVMKKMVGNAILSRLDQQLALQYMAENGIDSTEYYWPLGETKLRIAWLHKQINKLQPYAITYESLKLNKL